MCPFKTESLNTYSYHKKLHCIQANYKCSECSYSINNIHSLKEHIKLHKKEREMMKYSPPPSTFWLVAISARAIAVGIVTRWPIRMIATVPRNPTLPTA